MRCGGRAAAMNIGVYGCWVNKIWEEHRLIGHPRLLIRACYLIYGFLGSWVPRCAPGAYTSTAGHLAAASKHFAIKLFFITAASKKCSKASIFNSAHYFFSALYRAAPEPSMVLTSNKPTLLKLYLNPPNPKRRQMVLYFIALAKIVAMPLTRGT